MKRTLMIVIICLLLIEGFSSFTSFEAESGQVRVRSGSILNVGGTGGGNYSTIQFAIDAANPGDTVFVYSGTYYGNIEINITLNLVGEDKNVTNINGGGSGFVIKVNSNSVNITNLTIKNSGEEKYDAGIILYNSENCVINNNNISDNNENGIWLQELSENNKIYNNDIFNNTGSGIYLHTSNLNLIEGNYLSKNSIGIELKSSYQNLILNNDLRNNGLAIYFTSSTNNSIIDNKVIKNYNGVRLRQFSFNNNIINNNISHSLEYGIWLNSAPGTNISDNIFISNNKPGIFLISCQNIYIFNNIFIRDGIFVQSYDILDFNTHVISRNNLVNGKPLYYYKNCSGIRIDGISVGQLIIVNCSDFEINNLKINNTIFGIDILYSKNGIIRNNEFSFNLYDGIYVTSSSNITVTNNYIHSNNDRGISIYSSTNNNIISNDIHSNGDNGVDMLSFNNNIFMNNSIHSNKRNGISLMYYGDNVISGNNIYNNEENGIHFYNSNNNLIKANIVTSNDGIGIYINSSEFNKIYNNNIYSHTSQAFNDNNGTNFWNDTYPTGGNYWSDYAGIDQKSGLNQSQPGSDDIGDTPYTDINGGGGAKDHYPLMKPFDIESVEFSTPSKPKNLKANAGNGFIFLSWSLPESDGGFPITNFIIYKGTTSGDEKFHIKIGSQLFYNDTDVTNDVTYFYQVSAVNAIGEGPLSNEVNATPQGTIIPFTGNILYVGGSGPGNYTRIQDAIDVANVSDTVYVFDDSAPYYENIVINKKLNLIGESRDTTIISGQGFGDVLYINAENVNISGFNITYSGFVDGYAGIELEGVKNSKIERVNIHSNCLMAMIIKNSSNNIINNIIYSNNFFGIIIEYSDNNTIMNNIGYSNIIDTILIIGSKSNIIKNNSMSYGGIFIFGSLLEHWNTHVIDTSNTAHGKPIYYWKDREEGVIPSEAGQLILANCKNITVENLDVKNNSHGIMVAFSSDNVFRNNNISDNWFEGIFFINSSNNLIQKNLFYLNTEENIYLLNSNKNTIIENIFSSHLINSVGISIEFSDENKIANNIFSTNKNNIALLDSNKNLIIDNELIKSRLCLNFTRSNYNEIIDNQILDNFYGILINDSNNNMIFHNNLINNSYQAIDEGDNFWDNGYPTGGNYWSDYNGTDANGDGFGDMPYIIDDDRQDNYPLMEPWDIEIEEFKNITITFELTKSEYYVGETIAGTINITNGNPFNIALNDQHWQIMVGIFFNITSSNDYIYIEAIYNRAPIEVSAQSTLSIDFELYEMNTLSPEASGSVYLHLLVGNYSIYSYFYYGSSLEYEKLDSNTINFKVIDETLPLPGGDNGASSGTDDYVTTFIFASATGLVLLIIILTLFTTATEVGKYKFASMFVAPLYARELKKRKKKDDLVRGKIIGYVIGNPGDNYNRIKLKLKLTNGALAYHLKILEKKEEIRSERDGINRRFYPYEGRITEEIIELSRLQKRIFNLIKRKPGMTQTEISNQLGESVQKINYHIQMMVNARIIKLKRVGKHTKCFIIEKIL